MQQYPYLDTSLIEPNHFYTRTKASVILDIEPDVFDAIIFANIKSYSHSEATTGIFTGAEIIHAINDYYRPFLKRALLNDANPESGHGLDKLTFRAKYGIQKDQATEIIGDKVKFDELYTHTLLETYYPVPKGERKHH